MIVSETTERTVGPVAMADGLFTASGVEFQAVCLRLHNLFQGDYGRIRPPADSTFATREEQFEEWAKALGQTSATGGLDVLRSLVRRAEFYAQLAAHEKADKPFPNP